MIDQNFSTKRRRGSPSIRRLALLASAACLAVALAAAGPGFGADGSPAWMSSAHAAEAAFPHPANFAKLVAKVKPAVIAVRVTFKRNAKLARMTQDQEKQAPFAPDSPMRRFFRRFGQRGEPGGNSSPHPMVIGEGSGFFISPEGYAVTNDHVVANAKSIRVTVGGGASYPAKVVGADKKTDLALIKVNGKGAFPYVRFAKRRPRIGDWVIAVGNPYGLGGTVTAGIVSAEGRTIGSNPFDDYMQIDAPINKGNSGGPTFNMNGHVVGVNTAIYTPSGGSVGIGFDIPAKTVKMIVSQLKAKGYVSHGWLGMKIQSVTSGIANSLGLNHAAGVMVDATEPGSPAARAGLRSGDVITALNGSPLKGASELARKIGMSAPRTQVDLTVLRKGATKSLSVRLGRMPNRKKAAAGRVPALGLAVEPAHDAAGAGIRGVVITAINPTGVGARRGLRDGDVILEVGGAPVADAADLRQALAKAKTEGKHDVLMRIKTAKGPVFVATPVGQG